MRDRGFGKTLATDRRGVSEVVGFILVFGFLILALTTYQATVVPQQNAQTEFQHFEDVRNEMIELRNAVSMAGQADVSQFPSVTLGTNYRPRTLTINPPDPAGTLRTSDRHNITISNESGSYINISTRFIEYQPSYNEISIGSTWLEHSVLYLDERDRGGVSIIQEQNIIKNGTVTITALQNQFQETDTGRVTLEMYPQENVNRSAFPNGNLTVKVPTRLSEGDWNSTLNYSGEIYNGVDPDSRLNLSVNSTDLEVNTVGIREEPNEGPAKNIDPYSADSGAVPPSSPSPSSPSCTDPEFLSGNSFTLPNGQTCTGDVSLGANGNVDIKNGAQLNGDIQIDGAGILNIANKGVIDGDVNIDGAANGEIKPNGEITGCLSVGGSNGIDNKANTGTSCP